MLANLRFRSALFAWPLLVCLIAYLNACVGYTKREIPKDEPLIVDALKVLVLREGRRSFRLESPTVDQGGLRGRAVNLVNPVRGAASLPPKGQRVDLWLEPGADSLRHGSDVALPWDRIARIAVYDVSVGKTILIWSAGALGVVAIAFLIFLLTKSSCPFVYADPGGTGYDFQGEIFSGAIYPQLERRDWMPLPAPRGPEYRLRITNEVKEIQHIDAAALWLARHPQGTGVLLDSAGRPHTYSAPTAPLRCATVAGRDAAAMVSQRDSLAYMGGDGTEATGWADGLDLEFPRPAGARSAKLIVRGKNSFWLDYLYGRFQDLFGDGLEKWNGKMRAAPREKLDAWFREQKLPMTVELRGPEGWSEIASLPLPGPMAPRDFLVPFALPAGDGPVELRLRTGYLFWEVDYAALDFSPDLPVSIVTVAADTAVDQRGKDLRPALASEDGVRYDQPEVGDAALLSFTVPDAPPGQVQSAFLASRGYYDILRKPQGKPRTAKLKGFRKPGALARFSAESMQAHIDRLPHGR